MREIGHFIGGKTVKGTSGRQGDVFDPNTGEVQAKVALASKAEVEKAIANAEAAQPAWAATNPQRRARVCSSFSNWWRRNTTASPACSVQRQDLPDAKGDIQRALSGEFAAAFHLLKGEFTEGAVPTSTSLRAPAAQVVAGITHSISRRSRCGSARRPRLRQRLPPAVRARSVRSDAHCRTVPRRRLPEGISTSSMAQGSVDTLLTDAASRRRLVGSSDIAQHLFDHGKARAMFRRRQEPYDRCRMPTWTRRSMR